MLPQNTRFVCIKAEGWGIEHDLESAMGALSLSSYLSQGERSGENLFKGE